MPFCKYCGRHVPETDGTVCENCLKTESQSEEQSPYPLLLAPPPPVKSAKSLTGFVVLSIAMGVLLFFFLLGRRIIT